MRYKNRDLQMPPDSKLSPEIIADFEKWISAGAADPRKAEPKDTREVFNLKQRRDEHWSWHPPQSSSADDSIDSLVDAKLKEERLRPAGTAKPRELARRLSFDLIGLPPTPREIERFETNYRLDAEKTLSDYVDRLLNDRRFGEHWARHWLDVVRYSETKGHVTDQEKPFAYKYRDYVIDALNRDVPFDQFVREHIAGDLLPSDQVRSGEDGIDNLSVVGTSALFMHEMHFMAVDPVKQRWDEINAQIDIVGKAFLGLTTECARCHDHKFDAISQRDYYALAGIFWSTELGKSRMGPRVSLDDQAAGRVKKLEADLQKFIQQKIAGRRKAQSPKAGGEYFPVSEELGIQSPGDSRNLKNRMTALAKLDPSWSLWTRAAQDVKGQNVALLIRGDHKNKGTTTPRGFLTAVADNADPIQVVLPEAAAKGSGRLWLAHQIADAKNPLTSRVWANRLWHHLFGRGIVATPNNFGKLGSAPTNLKLLDFLAGELVKHQWSTKKLVRQIVLSKTYRRSSEVNRELLQADPENKYFAFHSKRRLTAEQLRDSMLFVSGSLDETMFGPSVDVYTPPYATGNKPSNVPAPGPLDGNNRRSVYIKVRRNFFDPFLQTFDFPNPGKSIGKRSITVVPTQSLAMLNSPLVHELAADWGARTAKESQNNSPKLSTRMMIQRMWRHAIGRTPTEREFVAVESLLGQDIENEKLRWKQVAHLLFNHPEFMWID